MGQQREDWLVLDQDECWFSRFVAPALSAWSANRLRVITRDARQQPTPAVACYGARRTDTRQVYLAICEGQPKSEYTWDFLQGLLAVARQEHTRVLVLIWDNATWHLSKRLRSWMRAYNQQAKQTGDVRLLIHYLPSRSPWLNPLEGCWLHAKRAVWEPTRLLELDELIQRILAYFRVQSSPLPFNLCLPIQH